MTFRRVSNALTAGLGLAVALGFAAPAQADGFPEKPIRIIVPTDAGGAMDTIARIFQRAFETDDALPDVAVVNMAGAGGTIGTRAIKDAEPDGYTIGLWHMGLVTSAAMGVTDYDHTAFEIVGGTGYAELGLAVKEGGRVGSFADLISMAKAQPDEISNATNIGLPVHFLPLMVQDASGAQFRYVQVGGGAKRLQSILGGHTDFAIFSVLEFKKFAPSGLKPIVVLTEERNALVPDVPTARENGVDVTFLDGRIWMAPKGTPADRVQYVANAFKTAMSKPEVAQQLADLGLAPVFVSSEKLTADLDAVRSRVEPLVEKARQLKK